LNDTRKCYYERYDVDIGVRHSDTISKSVNLVKGGRGGCVTVTSCQSMSATSSDVHHGFKLCLIIIRAACQRSISDTNLMSHINF
jgi:hypothetical protein